MPRVSREQSELNRAAIETAAARLFRERGIKGVSVADLMGEAGLTHGGFYGHFESKDALAALACAQAFEQSVALWQHRIETHAEPEQALASIARGYLSTRSRDAPGLGCPASALAADVAREPADAAVRVAYLQGLSQLVDLLATLQPGDDAAAARQAAMAQFSLMVGAQMLARACQGHALSDQWLAAARQPLLHGTGSLAPMVQPQAEPV